MISGNFQENCKKEKVLIKRSLEVVLILPMFAWIAVSLFLHRSNGLVKNNLAPNSVAS